MNCMRGKNPFVQERHFVTHAETICNLKPLCFLTSRVSNAGLNSSEDLSSICRVKSAIWASVDPFVGAKRIPTWGGPSRWHNNFSLQESRFRIIVPKSKHKDSNSESSRVAYTTRWLEFTREVIHGFSSPLNPDLWFTISLSCLMRTSIDARRERALARATRPRVARVLARSLARAAASESRGLLRNEIAVVSFEYWHDFKGSIAETRRDIDVTGRSRHTSAPASRARASGGGSARISRDQSFKSSCIIQRSFWSDFRKMGQCYIL